MSFVARSESTGKLIDLEDGIILPMNVNQDDLICQLDDCRDSDGKPSRMFMKNGDVIRAHFAHSSECTSKLVSHPESEEHMLGKKIIAEWLRQRFTSYGYSGFNVQTEVQHPKVGRIADVQITFSGGVRLVHEIQLSKITAEELEERTRSYRRAGISAVWWIGENSSADIPNNKNWLWKEYGGSYVIRIGAGAPDMYSIGPNDESNSEMSNHLLQNSRITFQRKGH
jgi:hypothetical protein